jgi:hypothetical protein
MERLPSQNSSKSSKELSHQANDLMFLKYIFIILFF